MGKSNHRLFQQNYVIRTRTCIYVCTGQPHIPHEYIFSHWSQFIILLRIYENVYYVTISKFSHNIIGTKLKTFSIFIKHVHTHTNKNTHIFMVECRYCDSDLKLKHTSSFMVVIYKLQVHVDKHWVENCCKFTLKFIEMFYVVVIECRAVF